ncbi:MAG: type II toxin-antitoxin system RelE/ParE family toxin [Desulfobulbaceae bacterium]
MVKVYQSRTFGKKVKKFNAKEKLELDREIRKIIQNPAIGTEKKGDLRGVLVHKFTLRNQLYLLAYRLMPEDSLELIMTGPHENYYRDLKMYLKKR